MRSAPGSKVRADRLMVSIGLAGSRERAQHLIEDGLVAADGVLVSKPGTFLSKHASLKLVDRDPDYASRGAFKLLAVLDAFPPLRKIIKDSVALDLGASTGGFVDVLLRHEAARVYAIDVGRGQLLPRLANDERVRPRDGVNARYLNREVVPEPIDILTADVSFISLRLVLPAALPLLAPGGHLVMLVKPQFELSREESSGRHVIRDEASRALALELVSGWLEEEGNCVIKGYLSSPITGPKGNREWLVWAAHIGPENGIEKR